MYASSSLKMSNYSIYRCPFYFILDSRSDVRFVLIPGKTNARVEMSSSPPASSSLTMMTEGDSGERCNGIPERRTLLRASESHGLQLLSVLRSFRERGLLFDFTIKAQEHSFPCHRCVLAACSDFFR